MTFVGAFKSFWKNYFTFRGRASRREFWFVVLWNVIIGAVLGFGLGLSFVGMMASAVSYGDGFSASTVFVSLFGGLLAIYSLAALIPSLSLSVRRYHDTGLSGWWFVGLYVVNLVIEWTTSGLVWSVIGLLVSIVMLIITLLPTNHFLKQAEE